MKKIALFFVASMVGCAAAFAAPRDHLLPEYSVIGGSESSPAHPIVVREVLHEAFGRDVKLRMIQEPSFKPEFAVALTEDNGTYHVLTLEPKVQLWLYESLAMMKDGIVKKVVGNNFTDGVRTDKEIAELESTLPRDYHDVNLKRCQVAIDGALAQRLMSVWKAVLLETRYTQPNEDDVIVSDGVVDHFSMFAGMDFLAGWTNWGPPEGGKVVSLDEVALEMSNYCEKPDRDHLKLLDSRIRVLEGLFQGASQN